jgi:hypothetical protein
MLGLVAGCTVGVDEQTKKQIGELKKESEQWRKESEQWRPLAEALNKSVDTTGKTLSASIVEASSKFGEGHDPLGLTGSSRRMTSLVSESQNSKRRPPVNRLCRR